MNDKMRFLTKELHQLANKIAIVQEKIRVELNEVAEQDQIAMNFVSPDSYQESELTSS